jgi:gag-polypeptide of LTR copia-type/Zinc knuckle
MGNIRLLDRTNYAVWREDCMKVLQGLMAWDIVMEEEEELEDPGRPNDYTRNLVLARKAYKDYKQRKLQAVAIIYGSCTNPVKVYIKGMNDPVRMWKELEARTNTAKSSVGRMSLFRKFTTLRPTPGKPINSYFAELLDISTELAGSEEAVSDVVLKNHIYTTLPPAFEVTIEILQTRGRVTVQEVIDALNECETNRSMTTKPVAVTEALYTQQGGRGGRGAHQGQYQGSERSKDRCDFCKKKGHTAANCWGKKRAREQNDCYYCGEEGHAKDDCPVRRKGQALRNSRGNERDQRGNGRDQGGNGRDQGGNGRNQGGNGRDQGGNGRDQGGNGRAHNASGNQQ